MLLFCFVFAEQIFLVVVKVRWLLVIRCFMPLLQRWSRFLLGPLKPERALSVLCLHTQLLCCAWATLSGILTMGECVRYDNNSVPLFLVFPWHVQPAMGWTKKKRITMFHNSGKSTEAVTPQGQAFWTGKS